MIGSGERTGTRDTITYDRSGLGGGQAGLAMGYQLGRRGISFVFLEAH